jgi:hypothetical protein
MLAMMPTIFLFVQSNTNLIVSLNIMFNSVFLNLLFLLFTELCVPYFSIFQKVLISFDKGMLFKFIPTSAFINIFIAL